MKKFQNLIGFPVRLYDNTLDILNRGLRVLGVPLGFTVGGIPTGPSVTAAGLTLACTGSAGETTAPMTIHLATGPDGGNDTTGDGTISKPFLTFTRALSVVPGTLKHTVRIIPKKGFYGDFPALVKKEIAGGKLIFDATGQPDTIHKTNVVVDSVANIAPGGSEYGAPQAVRITYLPFPSIGPSIDLTMLRFTTGVCAGCVFAIWDNDPMSHTIDIGYALGIVPGDLFDLIIPPVKIVLGLNTITFDFGQTPVDNHDQDIEVIGLAVGSICFSWQLSSGTPGKMMVLKNTVSAWAASQIARTDSVYPVQHLEVENASINTASLDAGTFINPVFDVGYQNWLGMFNGPGRPLLQTSSKCYLKNARFRNACYHGPFILRGFNNWFFNILSAGFKHDQPGAAKILNCFIDDATIDGNICLDLTASNDIIKDTWIDNCEKCIVAKNGTVADIGWLKMKAAAIRDVTALTAGNDVNIVVDPLINDLTGTSLTGGAVQFTLGDLSEYTALAIGGSALTDTAGSFIHSLGAAP